MHDSNHKNTCMACKCPCEMHKEHTCEEHGHKKESENVCMACECPCDKHTEHTHDNTHKGSSCC